MAVQKEDDSTTLNGCHCKQRMSIALVKEQVQAFHTITSYTYHVGYKCCAISVLFILLFTSALDSEW